MRGKDPARARVALAYWDGHPLAAVVSRRRLGLDFSLALVLLLVEVEPRGLTALCLFHRRLRFWRAASELGSLGRRGPWRGRLSTSARARRHASRELERWGLEPSG